MRSKLRSRLTYANVVATLALFLALTGGTAFAVTAIDDNSVRSNHIVNGEVRNADMAAGSVSNTKLAGNAVGSGKVIDNSLGGADVNESSLGQVPSAATATNAGTASSIANDSVTSPKVQNGSLASVDIFDVRVVKSVDVGSVAANSCVNVGINGVTGFDGDDLALLWPPPNFASTGLTFHQDIGEPEIDDETVIVVVCNNRPTAVDPPSGGWTIRTLND